MAVSKGDFVISYSEFINNTAYDGGGIWLGTGNMWSDYTLVQVENCKALNSGGFLYYGQN